ncbi:MAG: hypothetical protein AAB415_03050 [Patescibacteria group bacterium]
MDELDNKLDDDEIDPVVGIEDEDEADDDDKVPGVTPEDDELGGEV